MKGLQSNNLIREHEERIRSFYDAHSDSIPAASLFYQRLLAHYYNALIPRNARVLEVGCGDGTLLGLLKAEHLTGVDLSAAQIAKAGSRVPHASFHTCEDGDLLINEQFDYIILSDTVNEAADVVGLLNSLAAMATPQTRLLINSFSNLWHPLLSAARRLGLARKVPPSNWLGPRDVAAFLELAGWQQIKRTSRILCPINLGGVETLANRFLAPVLPWFCLTNFAIARLQPTPMADKPSVSIVIPARNEAGNIAAAVARTPIMGAFTELIFVEGGSHDDTWESIQQVHPEHPSQRILTHRQTGKGKANAVREGFKLATGDILMILDADLTTPPEDLPQFYQAVVSRKAEFANGSRLVYPMQNEAMRFLNLCANKAFGVLFSWTLQQSVKDTLCGTKVLTRANYQAIARNRDYFGDFDPFGDFDLLFGADKLNLKILDVPVRYRSRTYGSTNIHRWRHGLILLHMLAYAARKLRFI